MNAISGTLPAAVCDAARLGHAMDTAAAEWMASQDRQEGAPKDVWLREDAIACAIGDRLISLAEEVSWRKANSLEGAFAQSIAAGHFLGLLLDCDLRPAERNKATQALRRLIYSMHGAMGRAVGSQYLQAATQHSLSSGLDPFKQPAPLVGRAA